MLRSKVVAVFIQCQHVHGPVQSVFTPVHVLLILVLIAPSMAGVCRRISIKLDEYVFKMSNLCLVFGIFDFHVVIS